MIFSNSKKFCRLSILIIILFIGLPGCNSSKAQLDFFRYYNQEHNFSIRFPEAWDIRENISDKGIVENETNKIVLAAFSPRVLFPEDSNDNFLPEHSISIVIEELKGPMTLKEYYDLYIDRLTSGREGNKAITNFKKYKTGSYIINRNIEVRWIIFSGVMSLKADITNNSTDNEQNLLSFIRCFFIRENRLYIIQGQSTKSAMVRNLLLESARSFRFEGGNKITIDKGFNNRA